MPVEKRGQEEFEFEYGEDFERHIEEFNPTFAKALVHIAAGISTGAFEANAEPSRAILT